MYDQNQMGENPNKVINKAGSMNRRNVSQIKIGGDKIATEYEKHLLAM